MKISGWAMGSVLGYVGVAAPAAAFVKTEFEKWTKLIQASGAKVD